MLLEFLQVIIQCWWRSWMAFCLFTVATGKFVHLYCQVVARGIQNNMQPGLTVSQSSANNKKKCLWCHALILMLPVKMMITMKLNTYNSGGEVWDPLIVKAETPQYKNTLLSTFRNVLNVLKEPKVKVYWLCSLVTYIYREIMLWDYCIITNVLMCK